MEWSRKFRQTIDRKRRGSGRSARASVEYNQRRDSEPAAAPASNIRRCRATGAAAIGCRRRAVRRREARRATSAVRPWRRLTKASLPTGSTTSTSGAMAARRRRSWRAGCSGRTPRRMSRSKASAGSSLPGSSGIGGSPLAGCSASPPSRRRRPSSRFIAGLPRKVATNTDAGRWYSAIGVSICSMRPPLSTTMRWPGVIASTWSWVT